MAGNKKKERKKASAPSGFKPEKEQQVSVKQLVKDERMHKITGVLFIIFSIVLFVSFTSYLFTKVLG